VGLPAIKIGYTRMDIARRLSILQIGCPLPLKLIGLITNTREFEKELHKRFKKYLIRGEWFKKTGAVKRYIEKELPKICELKNA